MTIDLRWIWTAALLLAAFAVSLAVGYFGRTLNQGRFGWQRRLRDWLGVGAGKRLGELTWLVVALELALWPAVIWALLRLWGLSDEGEALRRHLLGGGFTVGTVTIVPARLLTGLFWFALLFTFTRWLKKKIEFKWLPRSNVEPATRDSVATLFGYVTFVIAALIGLSVAGVDFSKLALVAGALSVGIGFGLQNIVNNFVSGLIILFERPVRTGDYISINDIEGFVRRIRIRSTEIETVRRESVVVPNSDLLSNAVRNLNLRNNVGRIEVGVGVAYGSDTALVQRVLIELAQQHEEVIQAGEQAEIPGPRVLFKDFGESSLDFELWVFIHSVERRYLVASELRFSIDKAFRRHRITIPFPQRDLWLKEVPAPGAGAPAQPPSDGERA